MNDALDNELRELLPPDAGSHECIEFLLDGGVHRLIHVPLMVKVGVKSCIPRFVEWSKPPMLDEWPNVAVAGN